MSIAYDPARRIPPLTLPLRLQLAREWRGHTQDDLANVLDVSRATISNYERGVGKKGISKLQINAWAAFCDVDVEWLKTGREQETDDGGPLGGEAEETFSKITVRSIDSAPSLRAKSQVTVERSVA